MPLPTRRLLIEAVHAAAGGDSLISPSVTVWLLEHLSPPQHTENSAATQRLSPQEHKIVRFVARGRTNNEIPEKLTLSLSTVKPSKCCRRASCRANPPMLRCALSSGRHVN
ncbi:LuxR C-terminal-related transcriptional regulator [Streptomyces sp. NPDC000941]